MPDEYSSDPESRIVNWPGIPLGNESWNSAGGLETYRGPHPGSADQPGITELMDMTGTLEMLAGPQPESAAQSEASAWREDMQKVDRLVAEMRGTSEPAPQSEQAQTSSLLLVLPGRVEVNFVEWVASPDDSQVLVPKARRASISKYVPMRIFHKMLAERQRLAKLKAVQEGDLEGSGDAIDWMASLVLEVWKLSEPKMTLERLLDGLQIEQVLELFQCFFADSMRRMGERGRFLKALRG